MRKSMLKCLLTAAVCWAGTGSTMAEAYYAVVSNVSWRAHGESTPITDMLQIDYVPDGSGRAVVSVDGQAVIDSATSGTYVWLPQTNVTHTVEHSGWDGAFTAEYVARVPTTVSNVTACQRWPWNGLVDIDYTITGGEEDTVLVVCATDGDTGRVSTSMNFLGGITPPTVAGRHRVTWDTAADGLDLISSNVTIEVSIAYLYCIVDLSGGASATSYPVSYRSTVPAGGWTDEYKTTKLVLRFVPAGSFIMGGGTTPESHRVTLTKPFYVGVFEVTQKQWELVMGSDPAYNKGDKRPAEYVTYNAIRGPSVGTNWPASSAVDATSFLGKLRAKTGLNGFDLPTEAQWEYACRAGTTSTYNNGGDTEEDLKTLGRYSGNASAYAPPEAKSVGSYAPNAWGLYDMHGNVFEWCLDWDGSLGYGVDPMGSSSGSERVVRGGCWCNDADSCTSSYRFSGPPSDGSNIYSFGFRLVRTLNNKTE